MLDSFLDEFRMFINNRTIRINSTDVINNAEYINLSNKSNDLYYEILKVLPNSHKCLLGEYEHALNSMRAISDDYMYENGLIDGIKLRITLIQ